MMMMILSEPRRVGLAVAIGQARRGIIRQSCRCQANSPRAARREPTQGQSATLLASTLLSEERRKSHLTRPVRSSHVVVGDRSGRLLDRGGRASKGSHAANSRRTPCLDGGGRITIGHLKAPHPHALAWTSLSPKRDPPRRRHVGSAQCPPSVSPRAPQSCERP